MRTSTGATAASPCRTPPRSPSTSASSVGSPRDTQSGFRAFDRETLTLFATTYPVDYMDSVEALLLAVYAGLRIVEVPVEMRDRTAGVASNRNFKLIYHYLRLFVVLISSASIRGRHTREAS